MMKKKPILIFLGILIIAGILRLYRIGDYMSFLGDEGRDVLIVKRMIVDGDFTLLGPITSVGLMHLGPIYYYFMAPFLWLTKLDPVGPAIMVTLFSLATIWLIWKTACEFYDVKVAIIASLLYALSPLVIIHSHSSWNPNILPFWAMLIIYSLFKIIINKQNLWWLVWGLGLGVALQLHYIALVFIPITIIALLVLRHKADIGGYLAGFFGWLASFWPFILFEIRHQLINTQTVLRFITRPSGQGQARTFGDLSIFFSRFWDLTIRLFWRLVIVENYWWSLILMLGCFGTIGYMIYKTNQSDSLKKITNQALLILLIWYAVGVGLLSLYTGAIFDYYLMFAFPLPFLLVGIVALYFMQHQLGKVGILGLIGLICFFQFKNTPILREPNRIVYQTKQIADFILGKTGNHPYNFALIATGNSDHAYRYFLEINGIPPKVIENLDVDPDRKTVTDQLFVVCEEKDCAPLGYSLWEVAGFGRAEIEEEWKVGLFKVYKLVHYQT